MLSREEILKIANLAKIELEEEEIGKFRKELSEILDFVTELQKISGGDSEAKEPARRESQDDSGGQIMGLENITREDEDRGVVDEKGNSLIEQSPNKRDGFVVVPEVFKGEE